MRSDRPSFDFSNWATSTSPNIKQCQTPLSRHKTSQVNFKDESNPRLSISPIRNSNTDTRITSSPLRYPLQKAISRILQPKQDKMINPSRIHVKSTSNSCLDVIKKISYEDYIQNPHIKAHSQTIAFLNKYFNHSSNISIKQFIARIIQQYGSLWDNQNLSILLEQFQYKLQQIFDIDSIDPRILIVKTKADGMLGLIMNIFKQIKEQQSTRNSNYASFSKNPHILQLNKSFEQRLYANQNIQTIKNVIQQFMQSMYQVMQSQLYSKFNIQMRRMILKYRETDNLLKKINQKLVLNADLFELEHRIKIERKQKEQKIKEIEKEKDKVKFDLQKSYQTIRLLNVDKYRLEQENRRLRDNVEKLQNAIINKALEGVLPKDPALGRRTMTFTERSHDLDLSGLGSSSGVLPSQPQQLKTQIDHYSINKQIIPSNFTLNSPISASTNPNSIMPTLSPFKLKMQENKENLFFNGYSSSPYHNKFTASQRIPINKLY